MEITGKKISELEERTELGGGEYIPFEDNGDNGKIKLSTAFKSITLLTNTNGFASEIIPVLNISHLNTGSITSDQFKSLKKLLNDNNNQLGYILGRSEIINNDQIFGIMFLIVYYNSDSDTIHLIVSEQGRSQYRYFSNTGQMIAVANDYNRITVDETNQVSIDASTSDYINYISLPIITRNGKDTQFLNQVGGITDIQPIYNRLNDMLERLEKLEEHYSTETVN